MEKPEFIMFFRKVAEHKECTRFDVELYGYIYWLTKLKNEKCFAANSSLAELMGSTVTSIGNSLTTLERAGFIRRTYQGSRFSDRSEIIPLVYFGAPSPTDEANPHPQVMAPSPTGEQNKSIKKEPTSSVPLRVEKITKDEDQAPKKVSGGKKYPHAEAVFECFTPNHASWKLNTTQLRHAEDLYANVGLTAIKGALKFYYRHKDEEFCPKILSPFDLNTKWLNLLEYSKQYE
jgi:hypothetical protein